MHGRHFGSFLLAAALAFAGAAAQEPPPAPQQPSAQETPPAPQQPSAQETPPPPQQPSAQERPQAEVPPAPPGSGSEPGSDTENPAPGAEQGAAAEPPYRVECGPDPEAGGTVCLVDRDTYVGWRTFHSVCHTCHAQDAVGSTFAPDLLPRIRAMDKAHFVMVVDQGFTGQVGVMPAWGMNPNVNRYYDELWSYLRARADGVLLPGRPKRFPD